MSNEQNKWNKDNFIYYIIEDDEKEDREILNKKLNELGEEIISYLGGGICCSSYAIDIVKDFTKYIHNHPNHKHSCNIDMLNGDNVVIIK